MFKLINLIKFLGQNGHLNICCPAWARVLAWAVSVATLLFNCECFSAYTETKFCLSWTHQKTWNVSTTVGGITAKQQFCNRKLEWSSSSWIFLFLFLNQFPDALLRDEAFYVYFSLGMNSCKKGCLAEQFDLHLEHSSFSLGCSSWTASSQCWKCLTAHVPFGFRGQVSRITLVYSNVDGHVAHVLVLFFYLFPRDNTILKGASSPHIRYLLMLLITVKSQFFFQRLYFNPLDNVMV